MTAKTASRAGRTAGVFGGSLYNCIACFNDLNWDRSTFMYSCTMPLPATGQALLDPAALTEAMLFYRAVAEP